MAACRYSHSGVDLMRLNHACHAFATVICDTLHQAGAVYSMPSFSGPRNAANLLATESSRPLTGSQVRLHDIFDLFPCWTLNWTLILSSVYGLSVESA